MSSHVGMNYLYAQLPSLIADLRLALEYAVVTEPELLLFNGGIWYGDSVYLYPDHKPTYEVFEEGKVALHFHPPNRELVTVVRTLRADTDSYTMAEGVIDELREHIAYRPLVIEAIPGGY